MAVTIKSAACAAKRVSEVYEAAETVLPEKVIIPAYIGIDVLTKTDKELQAAFTASLTLIITGKIIKAPAAVNTKSETLFSVSKVPISDDKIQIAVSKMKFSVTLGKLLSKINSIVFIISPYFGLRIVEPSISAIERYSLVSLSIAP